jgi:hypothetical protein
MPADPFGADLTKEQEREWERSMDPLYDQRTEMPSHEFDGVDFFVNEPGRNVPPPTLLAYFDSDLRPPQLADMLDLIMTQMAATLSRTTSLPMTPQAIWVLRGQYTSQAELWTPETREAAAAYLRADKMEVLNLQLTSGDIDQHRWVFDAKMGMTPDPDAALSMALSAMDLWPAEAIDDAAEEVLRLIRDWAQPLRLRTAGVTYDRGNSGSSPWENWYSLGPHISAKLTSERVRGYYWANLLTAGHLARLGGLEQLRAHAAEHGLTVEPANADTGESAVILRAPVPISAFENRLLAAIKHVLGRAMIHKTYVLYEGYPLRIIPDPGTAFRRLPPGSPFPRLLPGEGPYADEVP